MGRDWLAQINIDFKDIHVVNPDTPITSLLNKYATVFGSDWVVSTVLKLN